MEINQQIPLGVREDHKIRRNVSKEEFSQLLQLQPRRWQALTNRRRQIDRVPTELRPRSDQSAAPVYDPLMVSLGPYHHGKPELRRAEEFKYLSLDWHAGGDTEKKGFLYNKILEKIDDIRDCYSEVTIVDKYDDKKLALMMLLDACFVINYIENCVQTAKKKDVAKNNVGEWFDCLGIAAALVNRDVLLLENQIPFQVIKMLMSLQHGENEAEELLDRFLSWIMFVDLEQVKLTRRSEEPPIHLLEACWRARVSIEPSKVDNQFLCKFIQLPRLLTARKGIYRSYVCSSVMDLKAKGIHFRPNSSRSLMDITFKSCAFYGELRQPVRLVTEQTQAIYSNFIAYEVSTNSEIRKPIFLSTVILMKSLIQSAADVKELEEKGILANRLGSQEEVIKVFKDINTFGLGGLDMFKDVKEKMEEHCNSKAKTWIADLINSRFRSPWTAIALFAAILLLCLTFLQTLFTIRPF